MKGFITLCKVSPTMSRQSLGDVTIAVDSIERFEQPESCYPTDVYLKGGKSFSVNESPVAIQKKIEDANG